MKKTIAKYIFGVLVAGIVLCAGLVGLFYFHTVHYKNDSVRKADVKALEQDTYDLLLLTMYSEETVSAYPFEYYMACNTYKPEHCFENLADISDYIAKALQLNESVFEIYTFFDPGIVSKAYFDSDTLVQKAYRQSLRVSITDNPDVDFVFLLPSYSMDYWEGQRDKRIKNALDSYVLFCNEFQDLENVKIYYFGHLDWMNGNPGNFVEPQVCTEEINQRMIALSIYNDKYLVEAGEIAAFVETLSEQIAENKANKVQSNLADYEIVFFGDSVIGNYSGSLSIPGVVKGICGADTYNCAIGGQAASKAVPEAETKAFDQSLEYFLTGNPQDAFADREQFRTEATRFRQSEHDAEKLLFVFGYGLNDYFSGRPIDNPADPRDIHTYCGALRVGVERIKQVYPEADIVLLAPTFATTFQNGTIPQGEAGGVLTEYVDALIRLADELNVLAINNYKELGVDETNFALYLEDDCHYNEAGRFMIAQKLIEYLEKASVE